MDRIYNPDRVEDDRRFTDGDFELGIEATPLAATFLNNVQEEVCAVIESAGMALDPDNTSQLLAAIKELTKAAGQSTQVQTFTKSATFIKPAGAKSIHVLLIGGGQGGASGSVCPPGGFALGGVGGIGGARLELTLDAALFPDSCAVIVGIGGAGGAPSAVYGLPGEDATETVLKIGKAQYRVCGGNNIENTAVFLGGRGGVPSNSSGGAGGSGSGGAPGGGAGGSIANESGWWGGYGAISPLNNSPHVTVHSMGQLHGGAALNIPESEKYAAYKYPGVSGGGGGARYNLNGGDGGRGGDGGLYGAGGGGGGATLEGWLSGAGGNGADGVAVITTYF